MNFGNGVASQISSHRLAESAGIDEEVASVAQAAKEWFGSNSEPAERQSRSLWQVAGRQQVCAPPAHQVGESGAFVRPQTSQAAYPNEARASLHNLQCRHSWTRRRRALRRERLVT